MVSQVVADTPAGPSGMAAFPVMLAYKLHDPRLKLLSAPGWCQAYYDVLPKQIDQRDKLTRARMGEEEFDRYWEQVELCEFLVQLSKEPFFGDLCDSLETVESPNDDPHHAAWWLRLGAAWCFRAPDFGVLPKCGVIAASRTLRIHLLTRSSPHGAWPEQLRDVAMVPRLTIPLTCFPVGENEDRSWVTEAQRTTHVWVNPIYATVGDNRETQVSSERPRADGTNGGIAQAAHQAARGNPSRAARQKAKPGKDHRRRLRERRLTGINDEPNQLGARVGTEQAGEEDTTPTDTEPEQETVHTNTPPDSSGQSSGSDTNSSSSSSSSSSDEEAHRPAPTAAVKPSIPLSLKIAQHIAGQPDSPVVSQDTPVVLVPLRTLDNTGLHGPCVLHGDSQRVSCHQAKG